MKRTVGAVGIDLDVPAAIAVERIVREEDLELGVGVVVLVGEVTFEIGVELGDLQVERREIDGLPEREDERRLRIVEEAALQAFDGDRGRRLVDARTRRRR